MSVLSDVDIEQLIKEKKLSIEPFNENFLQPASYDLRLEEIMLPPRMSGEPVRYINLEAVKSLPLQTAEFAHAKTQEIVKLPDDICGHIGLKSSLTRQGVIGFVGIQVDPTYEGPLYISLLNIGPRSVELKYNETYCTIEFYKLEKPAKMKYTGPYQRQFTFPESIKRFMEEAGTSSLYNMKQSLEMLEDSYRQLQNLLGVETEIRMVSIEEAEELIIEYLKDHEVTYPSDMADDLGLDLKVVMQAIENLKKKKKVGEI